MPSSSKLQIFFARRSTQPDSFCSVPSTMSVDDDAYRAPIGFVDVGSHDDVDDSGLVLERQKDEALGGARTLASDDEAAGAAPRLLRFTMPAARREHALRGKVLAKVLHHLSRRRDARRPEIEGDESLCATALRARRPARLNP